MHATHPSCTEEMSLQPPEPHLLAVDALNNTTTTSPPSITPAKESRVIRQRHTVSAICTLVNNTNLTSPNISYSLLMVDLVSLTGHDSPDRGVHALSSRSDTVQPIASFTSRLSPEETPSHSSKCTTNSSLYRDAPRNHRHYVINPSLRPQGMEPSAQKSL